LAIPTFRSPNLKPDRLIGHMNELPAAVESLMLQKNSA
jgi:hypothetical protein